MSFGIEFDIDADEYKVTPNVAFNGGMGAEQRPEQVVAPSEGDTSSGSGGADVQQFTRLFELTNKIRQENRNEWLNQYASMRIRDTRPDAPALREDELHSPSGEETQHDAVPSDNTDKPQSMQQKHQAGDSDTSNSLTMLSVLSVSSLVFAIMSVIFATIPVVGVYALALPGTVAVLLAVLSIALAYGARKSVVLPVIALVLTLASIIVAIGVNEVYEGLGFVHVTQDNAGTTISLG